MLYVYIFIWSLPIIVILFALFSDAEFIQGLWITIFLCLGLSIPAIISYQQAASQVGVIKAQQPIIAHYEQYVKELDAQLNEIPKNQRFTFNQDTPVKSLVDAKMSAQHELLDARKAVDQAKLELEQNRLSLLGFVVKWVENKE